MKITIERAPLLKALAHVQNVVEKRATVPILSNVLIAVRGGRMELTATDMEIAIVESVAAEAATDGTCTVPAAMLYDIVRKLPDAAKVELSHDGADAPLKLKAGRYSTSLVALPAEDFPSLAAGRLPHTFSLSALALRGLIDRTKFAISTEETRYYLNGIHLHVTERDGTRVLTAVTTDGHRLSRVDEPLPEGAGDMPGIIVPRKAVNEIRKLIDDAQGDVGIGLSDTRLRVGLGNIVLTTKLIDGTFPEYERVIPRENDKVLRVGKKALLDAVARVSAIGNEKGRPVKMRIGRDSLILEAKEDNGTASEELDEDTFKYQATPVEIGFQARYLNDVLGPISADVEIRIGDPASPAIVRDSADASALFVLMPIRV